MNESLNSIVDQINREESYARDENMTQDRIDRIESRHERVGKDELKTMAQVDLGAVAVRPEREDLTRDKGHLALLNAEESAVRLDWTQDRYDKVVARIRRKYPDLD